MTARHPERPGPVATFRTMAIQTAHLTSRSPVLLAGAVVFLAALGTIAAAWAFELIGGYKPCPLCLTQRWPYYFAIPVSAGALVLLRFGGVQTARVVLGVCGVAFLIGAGLGTYHAGIEWGWWKGPDSCTGLSDIGGPILEGLEKAPVVLCDEVQWRMFGLSFAGWNAVISLGLAGLAFYGLIKGSGDRRDAQHA